MEINPETIPKVVNDDLQRISSLFEKQTQYFQTRQTYDLKFRIESLKKLKRIIKEREEDITDAIKKDMGRPFFEAYGAEIAITLDEINYNLKHLKEWVKPTGYKTNLAHFRSKAEIRPYPKGVVLIVAAWNYPVLLTLSPLISALAAGNCAILKPSEFAVNSSNLVKEIITDIFPEKHVAVVEGDAEIGKELLKYEWDHILFTGSEKVGRIYAKAAAEKLIPITLEMGGKSPTIVHNDAKLSVAADRIVFAKFLNAGQTCVAPDYILVHQDVRDELIDEIKSSINEFYSTSPQETDDYTRIINQRHLKRLKSFLDELKEDQILYGGDVDTSDRFISPTLVDNPSFEQKIMQEEIFGPILPILTYQTLDEVYEITRKNPYPLALYIYSESKKIQDDILRNIQCGDAAINDSAYQFTVGGLPVGGIHTSGIGSYRGKHGFDTFSNEVSVFNRSTKIHHPFGRPPYTSFKEKLLKLFFR